MNRISLGVDSFGSVTLITSIYNLDSCDDPIIGIVRYFGTVIWNWNGINSIPFPIHVNNLISASSILSFSVTDLI